MLNLQKHQNVMLLFAPFQNASYIANIKCYVIIYNFEILWKS